ncbi:MAG: peptidoglycan editing factor PgeF [Myxococcaceae bacterium]
MPVPHGFSTRIGGVSTGPYASLNIGYSVGDYPTLVLKNRQHLCVLAHIAHESLHTVSQVHGNTVVWVSGHVQNTEMIREADALGTQDVESAVGIQTADCVPLLLAAPDIRAVMAVHSGWKGTLSEIAVQGVLALKARGADPRRVLVALGPSIRACCYEVSSDLASRFQAAFGRGVVQRRGERAVHLDLVFAIRASLGKAGVLRENVDVLDACTSCDADRFFSHRRDKGSTGRHMSFIRPAF